MPLMFAQQKLTWDVAVFMAALAIMFGLYVVRRKKGSRSSLRESESTRIPARVDGIRNLNLVEASRRDLRQPSHGRSGFLRQPRLGRPRSELLEHAVLLQSPDRLQDFHRSYMPHRLCREAGTLRPF
jgi:hypothetical protein